MYDLMRELQGLSKKLTAINDYASVQVITQAIIKIRNLEYDLEQSEMKSNIYKEMIELLEKQTTY